MPLGVVINIGPQILFMDGPLWWWAWLAGVAALIAFLFVAYPPKGLSVDIGSMVALFVYLVLAFLLPWLLWSRKHETKGGSPPWDTQATRGKPTTTRPSFTATSGRSSVVRCRGPWIPILPSCYRGDVLLGSGRAAALGSGESEPRVRALPGRRSAARLPIGSHDPPPPLGPAAYGVRCP